MSKSLSVAILGAGPAGLSAALWCRNLGMAPIVIERESCTGGMQRLNFLENDWVLGLQGMTGVDIASKFNQHVQGAEITVLLNSQLDRVAQLSNDFVLDTSDKLNLTVQAIIVATGTRHIGEEIFYGIENFSRVPSSVIVEGPYAFCDLDQCVGQHVAIVGGGDNAFENAMILLEQNCCVSMICRSQPRAQKKFSEAVLSHQSFSLFTEDSVERFDTGVGTDCRLILASGAVIDIDRLHVLAGYQANSENIIERFSEDVGLLLDCDQKGFLSVDSRQRTNVVGVYAAGDIHNTIFPNVISAMASGALAAKTISQDFLMV